MFLMGTLCYVVQDPPQFYLMKCETVIQHGKKSVKDGSFLI